MVLWGRFIFKDDNKILSMIIRNLAGKVACLYLYTFKDSESGTIKNPYITYLAIAFQ